MTNDEIPNDEERLGGMPSSVWACDEAESLPRQQSGDDRGRRPLLHAPPRSAYIHTPFCRHHCGYCNFSVVAGRDDLIEPLLEALAVELSWLGTPREVDTLYFGGGTPTHLVPAELDRLCRLALRWHPIAGGYEWTVEANPEDIDAPRLEVLTTHGVNRISLGAQSFRAKKLAFLERSHCAEQIHRAVELVRDKGMQVAIDLIFAAPGESLSQWQADLEAALALEPEHISTYGLTFEKGTQYWSRLERLDFAAVDEELERDMYLAAIDQLTAAGFEHYEVSNFARPGQRSRHNEAYWSGRGYFAAGPGAARYVDGVRESNHRSTTTYLRRVQARESPVAERERLDPERRAREFLVFALRRLEGVSRDAFFENTGEQLDRLVASQLDRFVEQGLLSDDGHTVRLTRAGLLVSDTLWPELL